MQSTSPAPAGPATQIGHATRGSRWDGARVGCWVALAAFFGAAILFLLHGMLNADEGFYLLATRFVSEGLHPYRDFGYTQGPVFPYIDVPWLKLFGFSLAGQRLASLAWTTLTIGLGIVVLRRQQGWAASAWFVVLLLSAPIWLSFAVKGKTYAFAGLMVLIGALAMQTERASAVRWAVFLVAAALGSGARFPVAAFFLPAGLWMLHCTPGWRNKVAAVLATIVCAAGLIVWAAGGAWESFWFWTVEFHRHSTLGSPPAEHFLVGGLHAPVLWLLVGVALIRGGLALRGPRRAVLWSLLTAVVLNLSSRATYPEYMFPFLPAFAWAVAPVAAELAQRAKAWCVGPAVIAGLALGWIVPPEFSRDVLIYAGEAEAFLREHVNSEDHVVCSMPEIPAATGHRVAPLFAMGKFGITEDFPREDATRLKLLTPAALLDAIEDPRTGALVMSPSFNWNFFWSLPSYREISDEAWQKMSQAIKRDYEVAFMNEYYVILLRRQPTAGALRRPRYRRTGTPWVAR